MMGDMKGNSHEYGLTPRICYSLFQAIDSQSPTYQDGNEYVIEFSHLEIYNETVKDLLTPSRNGTLKVREHPQSGVYVSNLTTVRVSNFEEVMSLIAIGDKERTIASTNMNSHSSRSHAIVTLTLRQACTKNVALKSNSSSKMTSSSAPSKTIQHTSSRIHLVDLAGSERATISGTTGTRLRETNNINRSLSVLGDVIKCLGESTKSNKKVHIPYRNSLLTMVLKDSLGGNSHTVMVAAVSPSTNDYEETISTLKYADRAKRVRMHVEANVITSTEGERNSAEELVPLLQAEVKRLREMLQMQQSQQSKQLIRVPAPAEDSVAANAIVQEMQQRMFELEIQLREREHLIQTLVHARHGIIVPADPVMNTNTQNINNLNMNRNHNSLLESNGKRYDDLGTSYVTDVSGAPAGIPASAKSAMRHPSNKIVGTKQLSSSKPVNVLTHDNADHTKVSEIRHKNAIFCHVINLYYISFYYHFLLLGDSAAVVFG